jgi:hypothetical protein
MIIYNVTISVNPKLEEEILEWMNEVHIPEVLNTKCFLSANMFRVYENPTTKISNSFAIQYALESWEKYDDYQSKFASQLQQKTKEKYGENILAFRTFLEKT